jgi:hypothetical protein
VACLAICLLNYSRSLLEASTAGGAHTAAVRPYLMQRNASEWRTWLTYCCQAVVNAMTQQ